MCNTAHLSLRRETPLLESGSGQPRIGAEVGVGMEQVIIFRLCGRENSKSQIKSVYMSCNASFIKKV
jgi:hypothetical protein